MFAADVGEEDSTWEKCVLDEIIRYLSFQVLSPEVVRVEKTTTAKNCNEGFRLDSPDGGGTIGSVSFVDSTFTGTKKAIVMGKPSVQPGTNTTGIVLDNT